ncbi:H(+)/Cl(-) exchange transporter ClcA [Methylocystis echinoides]|uniref:Voltage gated Cl- channel protein n=1 Tax=Methylocystis echinoides TaxID=29468 RepID=A0A9W6GVM3_9HYPH|nr:H(+)/Cl(-) exchange transporter ClcA [Methylocystis echinoides]GLI93690.1 voltage gated Cl- channel protein [Methylocystis echinoides]
MTLEAPRARPASAPPAEEAEDIATLASDRAGLLVFGALALVVGVLSGVVGALYRLSLQAADQFRGVVVAWAQGEGLLGFVLVVAICAAAACVAAWMVRRFSPHASGSGIPHVEAVLHGLAPPAGVILLPVKFIGGVLAIGSGLALGREGPSVQIGAVIGHLVGAASRRNWPDCRALLAAGAGAGLATAFNAPMAGAVFVLEELVQKFEHRTALAALAASSTAIATAHLILGDALELSLPPIRYPAPGVEPLFLLLGVAMGFLGIFYNWLLFRTLALYDSFVRASVETRAAATGALIGVVAWCAPGLVGGGEVITQAALAGTQDIFILPFVLMLRFGLGSASYSAGTPGGLFAPMLALGALAGLFFGVVCGLLFPGLAIEPQAFAVVGMTALFTSAVRAPLTGMVLVTEMTGSAVLLLPMLVACFAAMLAATAMGSAPVYEALRERLLRR